MSQTIDIINKLNESIENNPRHLTLRGFGDKENDFKSIDEIISKYDTFSYNCYDCGTNTTENVKEFIEKQRSFGLDDEEIIGIFNNPYGLLCTDCVD